MITNLQPAERLNCWRCALALRHLPEALQIYLGEQVSLRRFCACCLNCDQHCQCGPQAVLYDTWAEVLEDRRR